MTRRILSLFWIVAAIALACTSSAKAQTTVNSDGVSVRNSQPWDVFFMFPDTTNVHEIQLVCAVGTAPGAAFIYEEVNGQIVTYDDPGLKVDCNEAYGNGGTTFTGSLKHDITVTTPDHTITIKQSTAWTATEYPRAGWKETGGASQIVVQ